MTLGKSGGLESDPVVKGDINCHISAVSQGHCNLMLLVELIVDFKYNFKFETVFKR